MREPYTFEYFCEQVCLFRQVIGSTDYTLDEMINAFRGLAYCLCRVREEDSKRVAPIWEATVMEWEHRLPYMMLHPRIRLTRSENVT